MLTRFPTACCPLVYDELHRMSAPYLVGEEIDQSALQTTALINRCVRLSACCGWDPVRGQLLSFLFFASRPHGGACACPSSISR